MRTEDPLLAVVVPSHERPARLRALLDALDAQTLDRSAWEAVVVLDDTGEETEELLRRHPLAGEGVLRHVRLAAGTGSPARQRNAGWSATPATFVAFTDDDCRPEPGWAERLLSAARRQPHAIVQGATRPDPSDAIPLGGPTVRTLIVDPPHFAAQTCNILYPRSLLEAVGGFDEDFPGAAGEDTDLAERARASGAPLVAAPDAVVRHAVTRHTTVEMARLSWKWSALPLLVRRHPGLRRHAVLGVFWKPSHVTLPLLAAAAAARRPRLLALAAVPYLRAALLVYGRNPRAVGRAVRELPSRIVVDVAEIGALVAGSLRHRTLFL